MRRPLDSGLSLQFYSWDDKLPLDLHVHAEYPGVRQRFVIHAVVESPKELVTPHETSGSIFSEDAHGLGQALSSLLRIEFRLLFV